MVVGAPPESKRPARPIRTAQASEFHFSAFAPRLHCKPHRSRRRSCSRSRQPHSRAASPAVCRALGGLLLAVGAPRSSRAPVFTDAVKSHASRGTITAPHTAPPSHRSCRRSRTVTFHCWGAAEDWWTARHANTRSLTRPIGSAQASENQLHRLRVPLCSTALLYRRRRLRSYTATAAAASPAEGGVALGSCGSRVGNATIEHAQTRSIVLVGERAPFAPPAL